MYYREDFETGFCIYTDTICQGAIPIEHDESGLPVVYSSRDEAERELAADIMERIRLFLAGDLSFAEAESVDEYVVEAARFSNGSIADGRGNTFPTDNWL